MKKIILLTFFFSSICSAQFEFSDNFEDYISGLPLACQNPINWTTWSNTPCDPIEDPFVSNNHSYSGSHSVKISSQNDLIKILWNWTTGINHITFRTYIPIGKSGYIGLLSKFSPDPIEDALKCYFDVGGTGRLLNVPGEPILFSYTNNQWQLVWIVVNFYTNEAQFWIDHKLIYIWDWTQNGTISSQLAAQNFYGPYSSNEMYIDDCILFEGNCLPCLPPGAPTNLNAQQLFNTEPQVELNWVGNSWNQYAFKIIRKIGLPNDPSDFEIIGYTSQNINLYLDTNVVVDSTYTYGVIALNEYGYSDTSNFASITVEPVPVELVSFAAEVDDKVVNLFWTTSTETNNAGFEIERTSPLPSPYQGEGGEAGRGWETIGFVPGHGTTTEPQFYSFNDESLPSGKHQYRLKQIDYDGSFEYSKIVEVTIESPNEFSLSQNYPNPFNPSTKIKFTIPTPPVSSPLVKGRTKEGFVSLKVYDVLGNEVATLVNEEKPSGEYEVEFRAEGLPSGIYFYQLRAGDFTKTQKMVLLR